jgi:hypothetical protein
VSHDVRYESGAALVNLALTKRALAPPPEQMVVEGHTTHTHPLDLVVSTCKHELVKISFNAVPTPLAGMQGCDAFASILP